MKWPVVSARLITLVFCSFSPSLALAEPGAQPATQPGGSGQFMRFVDDKSGGGKLETAIVSYKNADGVKVDLIAAVHVGEKSYYEGLNKQFEHYDALLYEMVKPKGAPAPVRGQKSASMVSGFQRFLKDVLALDYQLDDIDYRKDNFIHADLDAEKFTQMQDERGESFFNLMLHSMLHEMEKEAEGKGSKQQFTVFDLLAAMRSPDRPRQLKLLLAHQFDDIEEQMSGMDGPNGSVIITERNKKCLETLKTAMTDGDKNIGIFYGAAHMGDMSKHLEEMGFTKGRIEWRLGWDMTAHVPATQPATQPAAG